MRVKKNEAGKVIGVSMDTEPKIMRPGPEPITTHNVNPLTREERRKAGAKAKAAQNEKA